MEKASVHGSSGLPTWGEGLSPSVRFMAVSGMDHNLVHPLDSPFKVK